MRRFAGIDLTTDLVPDETSILRFRHQVEKHRLTGQLCVEVRQLLEEKKLLLKSGTIVDATIIAAPPSTKNAAQERDSEMKRTRKGKQWPFGTKVHVGTDRCGLVHSVVTGPASEGDITRLDDLLHGQERELFGDQAYYS
jgi:IS5 family transposase